MVKPIFINKKKDKEKEKENEVEKEKENNNQFLSKKRAEPDTPKQDIDMVNLKEKINEIMFNISNEENNLSSDLDIAYEKMSKNYLLNEFTNNCLNYINKIILNVEKNHLKKFQGIFELNKIFISIIKELLMNEFELLLLSLYLESVNISVSDDIKSFKESLIFICFFIKKLTLSNEKLSPINSFLIRKYQGFDDKFNKWFESNSSIFNQKLYFSYAEINQRFKEFNKPCSIFCKNNYLDYNLIIDRILTMSIPYNESKGENHSLNKKSLITSSDINITVNNLSENANNHQNYLFANNSQNNYNNKNDLKNFYPNYIPVYPSGVFLNQNNFGCLYNNNANILCQLGSLNNSQNNQNSNLMNKETLSQKSRKEDKKNKGNIKFISIKEDNNSNSNLKTESNENVANPKMIFVTQTQNSSTDSKNENDSKDNNVINNNEIIDDNKKMVNNKKVEKAVTANSLLYSMEQDNLNSQGKNNLNDSNKNNLFKQTISNINNINLSKNNNNSQNLLQNNNILGLNTSQQINEYNPLKYNPNNFGINDINSASQFSLLSFKNPLFIDLNHLYNNYFQGIEGEQLYNQSRENLFKSSLSINGISSSKNFYPILNNYNFGNNINTEIENNNNISNNNNVTSLKNILIGNSVLPNLNNTAINNNGNLNINFTVEKNDNANMNKNNN